MGTPASDFPISIFFLTVVTLLNCPVSDSRVYRTPNAITIKGDADNFQSNDGQIVKNRREMRTDGRSCTVSGSSGYCTTLHSCYPSLRQSQMTIREISLIMARYGCQYLGEHDQLINGVCCLEPPDKSKTFVPFSHLITGYQPQESESEDSIQNQLLSLFMPITADVASVDKEDTSQQSQCGRGPAVLPPLSKIAIDDGTEAQRNSWPFFVALRFDGIVKCGGTLIGLNQILTAAHCVERLSSFDISKMTVSLGVHVIGIENDAQVTRRVSSAVIHNGYNEATFVNDIAILTLNSPVVYTDAISPVCLPAASSQESDQYAGQEVAMMGWGDLKFEKTRSTTLQQIKGTVVTNAQCMNDYGILNITKEMFCVSAPVQSACQGDSGGPVVIKSSSGVWTVVGINSFALDCGLLPGVKTKVTALRNWIDLYTK